MFIDLLLACHLVNTTCAVANIMANLIFTIVSLLHAFFLVVPIRSSLHAPVEVAVISCFQHTPAVQSNDLVEGVCVFVENVRQNC